MNNSKNYTSAKIEYIKQTLRYALLTSTEAHKILFKNSNNKQNELIATTYLNKAISLISTAKAIYISNIEELESYDVEHIFNTFDIFESEFLTNLSTDHSHQWTDIEFERFKDSVELFLG